MTKTKDNPLSNARKQQKGRSADEIWYRKAGLGYRCFIDYYTTILTGMARQDHEGETRPPTPATTTPATTTPSVTITPSVLTNTANEACKRALTTGMSRAAKRRRKRKLGNATSTTTCLEDGTRPDLQKSLTSSSKPPQATDASSLIMNTVTRHPLYRAWIEVGKPAAMEPFVSTLCRPLPVTVRVRASLSNKEKQHVGSELAGKHGFQVVTDGIYQLSMSKGELTTELQQLLANYHQSGKIARQELGSMLPVRMLAQLTSPHIRGARILDVCASPGSKTLQALEVFDSTTVVIANDINAHRLELLRDAVQRSGMADIINRRIQYNNQDASKFKLYAKNNKGETNLAKFRIILCDVPCSGDGTCRKDQSILPQWKPSIGNSLHSVQLAILRRSLILLKPGGYLCYSTCSMYPIENEAVVAAALTSDEGVALVDCPEEATSGFHLEPGLTHWKVAGRDNSVEDDTGMVLYESYDDALKVSAGSSWSLSMWPPSSDQVTRQLHRCRRLWPHHQNSGGFFIALFHRKNTVNKSPQT